MKNKKDCKNCWDYWKCSKEVKDACPAYQTDSGRECWLMATHFCVPNKKHKFKNCWECGWFKIVNKLK